MGASNPVDPPKPTVTELVKNWSNILRLAKKLDFFAKAKWIWPSPFSIVLLNNLLTMKIDKNIPTAGKIK